MIHIEINGKTLEVEQGTMIIEAADNAGIKIPRFCYHKKLSVAANCRMCLVEVENGRKPMPACATPVTDGMKVFTNTDMAIEAQKAVMEFLLINHPLDCPICDQGGECELQDVSVGYGGDVSQYSEGKRVVKDKSLGPLIATDMTRCIHCTRCVRFGQEIAGIREMGAVGRGEHTEIGTYVEASVDSELSGNVIDVCPVGALTSKPFRFKARAWELSQRPLIAPHDCVGSNIYAHIRRNEIMRVVPAENEMVNEVWISDRDRFSYESLNCSGRATTPLIKEDGIWRETDWTTALEFAMAGLQRVAAKDGVDKIAALGSPSATLEELYLLQKFVRGFGCNNVDHRISEQDFSDQACVDTYPGLGHSFAAIDTMDTILLVGSNVRKEQPIVSHRINQAYRHDGKIMAINPADFSFVFELEHKEITPGGALDHTLAGVLKALSDAGHDIANTHDLLAQVSTTTDAQRAIAQQLLDAERGTIFLGALAIQHPKAALIRAMADAIATITGCKLSMLTEGANAAGAWIAGAVPHRAAAGSVLSQPGLDAYTMFERSMAGYILLGIEPEFDCANPGQSLAALQSADFVVSLTSYVSATMKAYSNVIFPMSVFSETSGTYVNAAGEWQSFRGAVTPLGDSRPAWKILRVMGNLLELDGFDYENTEQVRQAVKDKLDSMPQSPKPNFSLLGALSAASDKLIRVSEKPIYAVDPIVRRAHALQETHDAQVDGIRLNQKEADKRSLGNASEVVVQHNDITMNMPLVIDDAVADGTVMLPRGLVNTVDIGTPYCELEIRQA